MLEKTGNVFNIQRFTIHDGPGIRTEVFLKGCSMRCKWCSNPESITMKSQLGIYPDKCIGIDKCGTCLKSCPKEKSPLNISDLKITSAERNECVQGCFACATNCPAEAIIRWGKEMSVADVMEIVLADIDFYKRSGGGITISGGEMMLQKDFSCELLKECKKKNIHTCVETALHCDWKDAAEVYQYTDMVITDIKHMDTVKHKEYTGVGNALILKNIERTVEKGMPLVIRIPVIAGINNDEENIRKTGEFIKEKLHNNILQLQLLPYRKLGVEKYDSLNLEYPLGADFKGPERSEWENNLILLAEILKEYGVPAVAGSNEKIL